MWRSLRCGRSDRHPRDCRSRGREDGAYFTRRPRAGSSDAAFVYFNRNPRGPMAWCSALRRTLRCAAHRMEQLAVAIDVARRATVVPHRWAAWAAAKTHTQPNCADLGSPTAVIWPKVGDGFVG